MSSEFSVLFDILLAVATLVYLARLIQFVSGGSAEDLAGEKRSLLNQNVASVR